jgi:hypothetical protein
LKNLFFLARLSKHFGRRLAREPDGFRNRRHIRAKSSWPSPATWWDGLDRGDLFRGLAARVSAALSGSMVCANLMFASVYS